MLKLEQKQTQTLSNKMIESLQVLQMSRGELAERLEELYAENPLLELDERGEAAPQPPEAESLKKLEWLARFDEQNAAYMRQEADDDEDGWLENIAAPQEETLADSLMEQLAGRGFGDGEMKIFRYIAESLDERGYFTERAGELASRFGIEAREAERLLGVMKRLDPPGICAGSLAECLALQLERMDGCEIEKEIVTHHLEALAKRQLKTIARELKIPVSRVLDALAKIQTLNPKPANGFTDGEPAAYVSPDVTVTVRAGDCRAELNFDAGASLYISRGYLELARRGDCPDEVRRYIAGKAREIEQISTNIKRRNDTLTELAACIAEEQRDFFVRGRAGAAPAAHEDRRGKARPPRVYDKPRGQRQIPAMPLGSLQPRLLLHEGLQPRWRRRGDSDAAGQGKSCAPSSRARTGTSPTATRSFPKYSPSWA